MKTRLLIIGIIIILAVSAISISLVYDQEIKLATRLMTSDEEPEPQNIPDPMCFVIYKATGGSGDTVTVDGCFPLSDFETLGCTKPMLEHIYKYTNLFDWEFDGTYFRNFVGLPEGVSEGEYEECADAIYEKRKFLSENREFETFSIVQGTKIQLEGVIMDMRLDPDHQYSFFTNDPRYTFSTDSNGITLVGLNSEDDLHGKIVKLSGTRTQRDLGIRVDNFEVIDSLVSSPKISNPVLTAKDIVNVSLDALYENPDQYYNRFVRVAGELSEHEKEIRYAGVGCDTAKYTTSDEFVSDGSSSRHLQDGDKIIGVRIGTSDDLGKVKEPLPDELKTYKVTVMGVFIPSVVERGQCDHVIHKSGYILTKLNDIKTPSEDVPVESDRITFQDKSLDYWKSLDFDQLREYNSKSDRDEFYYALGELLAKEYFLEKLVELNLVNANDDLIIHTGGVLLPDPPIIGFNTVVNATDGFSYVMHTSVQGNRLGEYFSIAQLVFEPHILSAIAENKPAPFTNKFGESPTIYIVTEDGDDKLSSNAVIIDFDQTNTITFVNNSPNSIRIQEVGENKIDEIPKNSWRTKAIVPGESLTMQFNSTGFYEFNVKKITDYFPDYFEHHATGEIVVFTENMTDYTFAEGLLMGSTFIQDAPRPEIPWQSIGAGNNRGLEIGIVDSVIEAFPNAYEYYLTKAKSLVPFDVPIIIEFSGPIRLD